MKNSCPQPYGTEDKLRTLSWGFVATLLLSICVDSRTDSKLKVWSIASDPTCIVLNQAAKSKSPSTFGFARYTVQPGIDSEWLITGAASISPPDIEAIQQVDGYLNTQPYRWNALWFFQISAPNPRKQCVMAIIWLQASQGSGDTALIYLQFQQPMVAFPDQTLVALSSLLLWPKP